VGRYLPSGLSAQLTSTQTYRPVGSSASWMARKIPRGSAESWITSNVVMTSNRPGSLAAVSAASNRTRSCTPACWAFARAPRIAGWYASIPTNWHWGERFSKFDQGAATAAANIADSGASLQDGSDVRHGRYPFGNESVLKPWRGEPVD
jgi:hypothetical protein